MTSPNVTADPAAVSAVIDKVLEQHPGSREGYMVGRMAAQIRNTATDHIPGCIQDDCPTCNGLRALVADVVAFERLFIPPQDRRAQN
jgi:hypothetical protein